MRIKAPTFVLAAASSVFILSAAPAQANDAACGMVLCMAAKAMGESGGSECRKYEKQFFNILKFKKGKFSASRTSNARESKLNQCPGADPSTVSGVIGAFGGVRSLL